MELTENKLQWAEIVNDERILFGQAKSDIMLCLASKIKEYSEQKKNIGIEMGILYMLADVPAMRDTYKQMIISEQKYKGAEVIVDSLDSKIVEQQSLRKYNIQNDGGEFYGKDCSNTKIR